MSDFCAKYSSNPDSPFSFPNESLSQSLTQSIVELTCEWDNYLNDGFDIFSINNGLTSQSFNRLVTKKKAKRTELKFDNALNFSFQEEAKTQNVSDEEIIAMLEKEKERLRNEVGSANSSVSFSFNIDQQKNEVSFDSNAFKSFKSNKTASSFAKKNCTVIIEEETTGEKNKNKDEINNNEINNAASFSILNKKKENQDQICQTDELHLLIDNKTYLLYESKKTKIPKVIEVEGKDYFSYYHSISKKIYEIANEENINYISASYKQSNISKNGDKIIFVKKKVENSLTNFNTTPKSLPKNKSLSSLVIQKVNDLDFNTVTKNFKIQKVYSYNAYHDIIETRRGSESNIKISKEINVHLPLLENKDSISIANDSKQKYKTMTPLINIPRLTLPIDKDEENELENEEEEDKESEIMSGNESEEEFHNGNEEILTTSYEKEIISEDKKDREIKRLNKRLNNYKTQNQIINDENKKLLEVISIFKKLSILNSNQITNSNNNPTNAQNNAETYSSLPQINNLGKKEDKEKLFAISPISKKDNLSNSNSIDPSNNTLNKISKTITTSKPIKLRSNKEQIKDKKNDSFNFSHNKPQGDLKSRNKDCNTLKLDYYKIKSKEESSSIGPINKEITNLDYKTINVLPVNNPRNTNKRLNDLHNFEQIITDLKKKSDCEEEKESEQSEIIPFHLLNKRKLYENIVKLTSSNKEQKNLPYYNTIYSKYVNNKKI